MRLVFAVLSACVLVALGVLASPAKAGDYYNGHGNGYYNGNGNGYYRSGYYKGNGNGNGYHRSGYYNGNGNGNGYSSSSCCYRRVVRYERTYDTYADRPYRSSYYNGNGNGHYRSGYYNGNGNGYYRSSYYNGNGNGYSSYSGYSSYADNCYRVPVADGRGGWVWGVRSSCY